MALLSIFLFVLVVLVLAGIVVVATNQRRDRAVPLAPIHGTVRRTRQRMPVVVPDSLTRPTPSIRKSFHFDAPTPVTDDTLPPSVSVISPPLAIPMQSLSTPTLPRVAPSSSGVSSTFATEWIPAVPSPVPIKSSKRRAESEGERREKVEKVDMSASNEEVPILMETTSERRRSKRVSEHSIEHAVEESQPKRRSTPQRVVPTAVSRKQARSPNTSPTAESVSPKKTRTGSSRATHMLHRALRAYENYKPVKGSLPLPSLAAEVAIAPATVKPNPPASSTTDQILDSISAKAKAIRTPAKKLTTSTGRALLSAKGTLAKLRQVNTRSVGGMQLADDELEQDAAEKKARIDELLRQPIESPRKVVAPPPPVTVVSLDTSAPVSTTSVSLSTTSAAVTSSAPSFGTPTTSVVTNVTGFTAPTIQAPTTTSLPSFGVPSATASSVSTSAVTAPSFPSVPQASSVSFGSSTSSNTATAPSFNVPSVPSTSSGTTTTTPSFGVSGQPAPSSQSHSSTPSFGQPSSQVPSFGTSAPGQPTVPSFGQPNQPSVQTSQASAQPNPFAQQPAQTQPSQTPSFGQQPTQTPSFGQASSAPSNPFGQQSQQPTQTPSFGQQPSQTPSFGQQPSQTPSFGQQPSQTPSFGQQPSQTPSFGQQPTQTPSFGQQPSQTPSFGQQPSQTPSFGQQPSQTPSFGQASSAPSNPFGQQSQQPTQTPSFGQQPSQTPSFGQQPTQTPSFGQQPSQTPSFGQQPTQTPSFGQASSAPSNPFGQQQPPSFGPPASSNPFGAQPGGSNPFNAAPSNPFSGSAPGTPGQPGFAMGTPTAPKAPRSRLKKK